jgi:hypothetical protein
MLPTLNDRVEEALILKKKGVELKVADQGDVGGKREE